MAGRMINGAAALAELVRAAGETETVGVHRVLPVASELSGLLPGRGLRRGSTVSVDTGAAATAGGGTSLLLGLLAEASRSGSWCAIVGVPTLGAIAAAESGIALDRLALVPNPGPDWPTVVAALIDGVDMVVTAVPGGVSGSIASRLAARARQRGSVLMPFGPWSGADVTLRVVEGRWEGLGPGRGRLRRREVTVRAQGRGSAARPKEITLWMPGFTTGPLNIPPAPAVTDPDRPTWLERSTGLQHPTRPEQSAGPQWPTWPEPPFDPRRPTAPERDAGLAQPAGFERRIGLARPAGHAGPGDLARFGKSDGGAGFVGPGGPEGNAGVAQPIGLERHIDLARPPDHARPGDLALSGKSERDAGLAQPAGLERHTDLARLGDPGRSGDLVRSADPGRSGDPAWRVDPGRSADFERRAETARRAEAVRLTETRRIAGFAPARAVVAGGGWAWGAVPGGGAGFGRPVVEGRLTDVPPPGGM
jgi:hypothetical protein